MNKWKRAKNWLPCVCALAVGLGVTADAGKIAPGAGTAIDDEWPYYGHDAGGTRFSPLTQINRENVARLKVAWTLHTGDISEGRGARKRSGFESTPLLVDGTVYLTTPFNRVIALDPETGAQRWAYDPKIELGGDYGDGQRERFHRALRIKLPWTTRPNEQKRSDEEVPDEVAQPPCAPCFPELTRGNDSSQIETGHPTRGGRYRAQPGSEDN